MELFLKAAGAVLVAVLLSLTLSQQSRNTAAVLSMAVCAMVLLLGLSYLQPVLDFLEQLESLGNLSGEMISVLFKVTGISLISEIAAMICTDSGNASLAKALQILTSAVILWLSIPVFNALIDLVRKILEEV